MATRTPIVFFGSGPVALRSLRSLTQSFEIEAVITKPATAREMQQVVVRAPVFAVSSRLELDALLTSHPFQSSLAILIDFGIIVSQLVIDSFQLGIINSHFSLLPEWRGADPITFALLSGQTKTGVSLMVVTAGVDEGPLLSQAVYDIPDDATTPELTDALILLSNKMLKVVVPRYAEGDIQPVPQELVNILGITIPTFSRKLTKTDGVLDWHKPAIELEREIRAFITWPKSHTKLAGRELVVTRARLSPLQGKPGQTIVDGKHLFVCCGQDALELLEVKPAGKSTMSIQAFLAGYRQSL